MMSNWMWERIPEVTRERDGENLMRYLEPAQPLAVDDVLAFYAPGETEYTFSRNSAATQRASNGSISSVAANLLRDGNFVLNPATGLYERSTLIEGQRTNVVPNSVAAGTGGAGGLPNGWGFQLGNATLMSLTVTKRTDAAFPGCEVVKVSLTNNDIAGQWANLYFMGQGTSGAAAEPAQSWAVSAYLRKVSSGNETYAIGHHEWDAAGAYLRPPGTSIHPTSSLARFSSGAITTGASTAFVTPRLTMGNIVAGATVEFELVLPQGEQAPAASTPILTSGAAVTRRPDWLRLKAPAPQPMTIYTRWVEMGTVQQGSYPRVWMMGRAVAPRTDFGLISMNGSGRYSLEHWHNGSVTGAASTSTVKVGDLVEAACRLYEDGSVSMSFCINGGTPEEIVRSVANPNGLQTSWAFENIGIGSYPDTLAVSPFAFLDFMVVRKPRTLDELRTLAGVA